MKVSRLSAPVKRSTAGVNGPPSTTQYDQQYEYNRNVLSLHMMDKVNNTRALCVSNIKQSPLYNNNQQGAAADSPYITALYTLAALPRIKCETIQ